MATTTTTFCSLMIFLVYSSLLISPSSCFRLFEGQEVIKGERKLLKFDSSIYQHSPVVVVPDTADASDVVFCNPSPTTFTSKAAAALCSIFKKRHSNILERVVLLHNWLHGRRRDPYSPNPSTITAQEEMIIDKTDESPFYHHVVPNAARDESKPEFSLFNRSFMDDYIHRRDFVQGMRRRGRGRFGPPRPSTKK